MSRCRAYLGLVLFLTVERVAQAASDPRDDPRFAKIPRDYRVGVAVSLLLEQKYGLAKDEKLARKVADIGYRVAAASGQTDIHFVFSVLDMSDPNALALPGGFVFITKGILDLGLTDDELAHVLAHECSHVIREHHRRIQKSVNLINVINAAVLAGAIVAAQGSGPQRGTAALGMDRSTAAPSSQAQQIATAAVLSGVASNLLLLRYVREYEIEADRTGRVLATGAGFSPQGSSDMLRKLLSRSYERPGMGILRTHPYLEERIELANAQSADMTASPTPRDPISYRNEVQEVLLYRATDFWESGEVEKGRFLLRNAYAASPAGPLADDARVETLLWLEEEQNEESYRSRDYGYFRHSYQRILEEFPTSNLRNQILEKLAVFGKAEGEVYPQHLKRLDQAEVIPAFGEYFLKNYPEDGRLPEAKLKLADSYAKGRKYDSAAKMLLNLLEKPASQAWMSRALQVFDAVLPKLSHVGLAYRYHEILPEAEPRKRVGEIIRDLIQKSEDIEDLGQFREEHAASVFEPELVSRLRHLAEEALRKARFYRKTGNLSDAAFEYYKVSRYSPDHSLAGLANEEIREMQDLE
ncbi:MAG: M48 family metalloprotease [Planctomycetes bacterium]|nr:M48 family metalloprotease [Planctomycetota bacterium]